MSIVNAFMRPLVDLLLAPFGAFHPLVGLTVWSAIIGVLALYVFKFTSDQDKLARVKRRIHASLFEIRLWNDDARAIVRSLFDILRHNLGYVRLSLVPLLWMIVPLVLLLGQMQYHYGYRGLAPGEETLLEIALTEDWQEILASRESAGPKPRPDVELVVPAGLTLAAGPVWVPGENELTWRLRAEEWGEYEVVARFGETEVSKTVEVSERVGRRSPVRPDRAFAEQLLYPAEAPLPADVPVRAIALGYGDGNIGVDGWESEWAWMLYLFVASIIVALALRKPLGVTI